MIDRYVITDSAGQMLGSLPSGVGHVGSGAPSHQAGWYPPTVVRAAVQEAGLVWADLDFVGDSAGLDRLFPGLVPDLGQVQVVWWLWAFMLTGFGLYSMIWPWQLRHQPASAGYIAFMVLLGAAFVCLGVLAAPVMQRRWRKCAIRQQVTDAAS